MKTSGNNTKVHQRVAERGMWAGWDPQDLSKHDNEFPSFSVSQTGCWRGLQPRISHRRRQKQTNKQIKEKSVVSSQRTGKGEKPSPVGGKPFDDTSPTPASDVSRDWVRSHIQYPQAAGGTLSFPSPSTSQDWVGVPEAPGSLGKHFHPTPLHCRELARAQCHQAAMRGLLAESADTQQGTILLCPTQQQQVARVSTFSLHRPGIPQAPPGDNRWPREAQDLLTPTK